jgi:hypothetical protein
VVIKTPATPSILGAISAATIHTVGAVPAASLTRSSPVNNAIFILIDAAGGMLARAVVSR